MSAAVELQGVGKTYGKGGVAVQALHPLDLGIRGGELVVILGPSGSGKTTLLNLIAGLDVPSCGRLLVGGEDVTRLDAELLTEYRRRQVGIVFQFFNLLPALTALENVELVASLVPTPLDGERLLDEVGMSDRLHHFPSELSGGQQQRVAIARALVKDPPLLLADEPTGNLDYESGLGILKLFKRLQAERGKTILLVTHNAAFREMADRVVELRSGRLERIVENAVPRDPADIVW